MSPTDRVALDAYVIDSLMPDLVGHDRRPSTMLVFLYLWRRTKQDKSESIPGIEQKLLSMFVRS